MTDKPTATPFILRLRVTALNFACWATGREHRYGAGIVIVEFE